MSKRLTMLEALVSAGQADSFTRYALALEYRKLERSEDALRVFAELRRSDPDYLAMYLMAGQLLVQVDRITEAREWLRQGSLLAQRTGDAKAHSEIESLLVEIAGKS